MADVAPLADYKVKIEGEEFQLTQIPDEKSKLVEAKKKDVLKNLNLNEMISGLKRSGQPAVSRIQWGRRVWRAARRNQRLAGQAGRSLSRFRARVR